MRRTLGGRAGSPGAGPGYSARQWSAVGVRIAPEDEPAAAERGFFRALKELRQLEQQAKSIDPAVQAEVFRQELGSFLSDDPMDAEFDAMAAEFDAIDPEPLKATPEMISRAIARAYAPTSGGRVDVPFTIGRSR